MKDCCMDGNMALKKLNLIHLNKPKPKQNILLLKTNPLKGQYKDNRQQGINKFDVRIMDYSQKKMDLIFSYFNKKMARTRETKSIITFISNSIEITTSSHKYKYKIFYFFKLGFIFNLLNNLYNLRKKVYILLRILRVYIYTRCISKQTGMH